MKYIVYRTSGFGYHEDPKVEGAVQTELHFIDHCFHAEALEEFGRTHTDIKQVSERHWTGVGVLKKPAWTIEINTIEELMAFIEKHGEVIVWPKNHCDIFGDYPAIEVYDDYRE